ncbi:MAG TPA: hypothetical protein ENJ10_05915 [Caldithrix abyssi]|uniref:Uncharacterized protein n=1 Tax=Caldithrix abyssi TaxID=187145 RepID=A0A7V1LLJ6_CALAY|nr:hypothetical protein [Caldithrix abyssi]
MKKILLIALITVIPLLAGGDVVFTEYSAQPEANKVVVSWVTSKEVGVKSFVIKRSMDNKTFIELSTVPAKGPGYRYEYIDNDVLFKGSNVLYYKVAGLSPTGEVISETTTMNVLPNISGLFRTWGAIKAVFR